MSLRGCAYSLLLAALPAVAAEPPAPPWGQPIDAARMMQLTSEHMDEMRRASWELPAYLGDPPADESGRKVADDVARYVLTESSLREIETLQRQLGAAVTAGTATLPDLDPLKHLVLAETCRISVVSAYWTRRRAQEYHRDLVEQLVRKLPEHEQSAATRELRLAGGSLATLRAQVEPAMQHCRQLAAGDAEMAAALPSLLSPGDPFADYTALRVKLAARIDAARIAAATPEVWTERTAPCPEPAASTSGRSGPAARFVPSIWEYFPAEARLMEVGGVIRVKMSYDATGCVKAASVLESSGAEVLDLAAIQVVFAMALLPGESDGKPVEGVVVQPVRFSFLDLPKTAPAAAQPQP